MVSDGRFSCALALALGLAGCAGSERRFPLREPLWQDTDRRPVSIDCEARPTAKEPQHIACSPEPYVSPLAWDGADNSIFRPLTRVFAVDPAGPAPNVNAFDEVPDSAWFQNRIGKHKFSAEEILRGACTPEDHLEGETAAPGSWHVDQGKPNGASPGFRIKLQNKQKYLLKTDSIEQPERPSAASAIGAAIYHLVGFNSTCEQIVYFDPAVLTLEPGLLFTDNSGLHRRFDQKALEKVFQQATKRGPLLRMQASSWLPGSLLGPFRYEGTRSDDPNDVIPHQDRRDLRGARVLAAWLNHFDAREQNTMDSWIALQPSVPDSSPGFIRHYYLDTSDVFGSEWDWDGISRRLGHSYLLDWGDIGADFVTFGLLRRPWERVQRVPGYELFGYFSADEFEPDAWKNEYPNPAFSRATEADNAWMARILSRFDRADIDRLVTLGRFTRPEHTTYLAEVLEQRLRKILLRYFAQLSPLTDPRLVEPSSSLCMLDLARRRAVAAPSAFRYRAALGHEPAASPLAVDVRPNGEVCVTLPHASLDDGAAPDAASRYRVVTIENGFARYPLLVHLYDLGPATGFRIVGLERPEQD